MLGRKANSPGGRKSGKLLGPIGIVVLGIVVAFGVYKAMFVGKTQVLVAVSPISAHTMVNPKDFTTETIFSTDVPQGAVPVSSLQSLNGQYTMVDIQPGLPITTSDFLSSANKSILTAETPPGTVLVAVPVNNITGVSPELTTYDRVDVYANFDTQALGNVTKLMLQDVQIVSVNGGGKSALSSVVVAVSPSDAENLLFAEQVGTLDLAVVPVNYQDVVTNGVTDQLFITKYINNAPTLSSAGGIVTGNTSNSSPATGSTGNSVG